jgi:hypothetical protein
MTPSGEPESEAQSAEVEALMCIPEKPCQSWCMAGAPYECYGKGCKKYVSALVSKLRALDAEKRSRAGSALATELECIRALYDRLESTSDGEPSHALDELSVWFFKRYDEVIAVLKASPQTDNIAAQTDIDATIALVRSGFADGVGYTKTIAQENCEKLIAEIERLRAEKARSERRTTMNDPTYVKTEINANPAWSLAFVMSEIMNDNAPIGWGEYIFAAKCLLSRYEIKPKTPMAQDRESELAFRARKGD